MNFFEDENGIYAYPFDPDLTFDLETLDPRLFDPVLITDDTSLTFTFYDFHLIATDQKMFYC